MPITVSWFAREERVVLKHYSGRWNWDDVMRSNAEVRRLLGESGRRADLIVFVHRVIFLPGNLIELAKRADEAWHPAVGITVVVGARLNHEMMQEMALQFPKYAERHFTAETVEDAMDVIRASREGRPIPAVNTLQSRLN